MIADRNSGYEVNGNLVGDKIAMQVNQAAMAHIMSVLTELYADPELAIVREYSTNAYDAHVESGQTRPIEVTLPAPLSPFLRIKDFGVGLSVEDIHEIYSQYGASTKRATNDQVGMLGLGCKSALAYTNQFTLVSVKDGTRVQVSVSRDDDGGGSMTVVDTSATSDPDGTEVVIPVKRNNQIEAKARTFFSYWQEGTVLVNGKEPKRVDGMKLTDDLMIVKHDGGYYNRNDRDRVIMGNVAYPCTIPDPNINYGYAVVARVPIGSVNFTPSREALMDTPTTKATLADLSRKVASELAAALQRNVDAAPSAWEAVKLVTEFRGITRANIHNFSWRGKSIPGVVSTGRDSVLVPAESHVLSRHNKTDQIATDYATSTMFVCGYDRPTFTPGQKKKINQWATESGKLVEGTRHYALLSNEPAGKEWIEPARIVDWKEIEAVKLPKKARSASGRIPGSYDVWTVMGMQYGKPAADIDQSKPILWWDGGLRSIPKTALEATCPDASVVVLAVNRVDKFKRLFPNAKKATDAIKESYQKWFGALTDEQKLALAIHDAYNRNDLQVIDPSKVDDPDLKSAAKAANVPVDALLAQRRSLHRVVGALPDEVEWTNPLEKYPLFNRHYLRNYAGHSSEHTEHLYNYLNDAYRRSTKED